MLNHKSPEIRFKGFREEWETSTFLHNIKSIIDFRGRTPKKLGLDWSSEGYLALSALNVKNGYIDPDADAHYGDEELYQKWMGGNELKTNQVLFTTEAPMGNVAQVPDDKGYILSQRTIAFNVDQKKITDDFLAVLLRSPIVLNKLEALSSGGTAKGVSQKSIANLEVNLPSYLQEQTKIGFFFQQLDQAIALHQRKHTQTLNLKKAMLEKMFPKAGCTQPEIRFKGFSGEWKKQTLDDVAEIYDGTHQTPRYTDSGVMFLSVENIDSLKSKKFISKEDFQRDFKVYPQKNDVLMTRIGDVGTAKVVISDELLAYYVTLALMKPKNINPFYLVIALASNLVQQDIWKRTLHIAFPKKINMSEIRLVGLFVPSTLEEQTKIGNFFKQLDDILALQTQQLAKLKNTKQACLEKMFV